MSTNAIAGVGATFGRENDVTTGVYTALAEVNRIGGPTATKGFIDVTSLDSAGGYREFISTFRDAGEVTLEMNWTLSGYNTLLVDFNASTTHNYRIGFPNTEASSIVFAAHVTGIPTEIVPDDKITTNVTFKLSGQFTLST